MDKKIRDAVDLMISGVEPTEAYISTGGRPKTVYRLGGMELTSVEMAKAKGRLDHVRLPSELEAMPKVMTPEQLTIFARSGVPALLRRATELAMNSEDIRAILMVANSLADRGYGKAVQGVVVHIGDDINAAWKEIGALNSDPVETTLDIEDDRGGD